MQTQNPPLILSFGVADPVGATGIQGDLATFGAFGCHGLSVLTGMLISDTARVEDWDEIDADSVVDQARVLLEDMPVAAFKVGALTSIEQASAIAEIVSDYPDVPLILDPFLSTMPDSGLLDDDMLVAIRQILVPQATLLMLSQVELARMAETWREGDEGGDGGDGGDGADGADERSQAETDDVPGTLAADVAELTGMGCQYVLVTGTGQAHADHQREGAAAPTLFCNTLFDASGAIDTWHGARLAGAFTGAGSTQSAAIAALLAVGRTATEAVCQAQAYTHGALAHAQRFGMGKLIPNRLHRPTRF